MDLNSAGDVVLRTAHHLAQTYRAKLCLLHIESSSAGKSDERSLQQAFEKAAREDGQETAVDVKVRVLDGAILEGIRRTVSEESADLLIVGHQRGGCSIR